MSILVQRWRWCVLYVQNIYINKREFQLTPEAQVCKCTSSTECQFIICQDKSLNGEFSFISAYIAFPPMSNHLWLIFPPFHCLSGLWLHEKLLHHARRDWRWQQGWFCQSQTNCTGDGLGWNGANYYYMDKWTGFFCTTNPICCRLRPPLPMRVIVKLCPRSSVLISLQVVH